MNIYVCNLSSVIQAEELKTMFSVYGDVQSAEIVRDIISGESRGFGFIEMNDNTAARKAIAALDQVEVDALAMTVQEDHA